ncbi:DNA cytosine methyltransferase [Rhodococcoides fascians]|uniref:DNA cytosine methyltransferase n=1 Tax=Rhodococcoides fascians TaxID=1828 RepID=UPI00050C72C4|nr:DNA cytosine methyltransferase [Rhodococcus fascians]
MDPAGGRSTTRYKVIDLFAGPGGLDVGAHWLGMTSTGIEIDPDACATRAEAALTTEQADVRHYGPDRFPEANVLTGGPPCQTYTLAGKGSGRQALDKVVSIAEAMAEEVDAARSLHKFEDERTGLVLEPLRWALEALKAQKPYEAIVLEQVPAVIPIWEAIGDVLRSHGYGVDYAVLRTEQFGVPQTRRRAILVARWQDDVSLPRPTHEHFRKGATVPTGTGLLPWVPMQSALRKSSPFTVVSNYGSGGDPRKRGERTSAEPAATVTGKATRNKIRMRDGNVSGMTTVEAGLLQTFPADYPWSGRDISQQIGNAIPPRLATHVLAAVLKLPVSAAALDVAVTLPWSTSRVGVDALVGTSV